jgi:predicted phage tail protein
MARDYKTGRFLARVVSALGWVFAGLGVLVILFAFATPFMDMGAYVSSVPGTPASGLPVMWMILSMGLGLIFSGVITIAMGQATRALMDNADYTRQLLDFIQRN